MINNRGLLCVLSGHYIDIVLAVQHKPPFMWQLLMDATVYLVSTLTSLLLMYLYLRYINKK